MSITFDYLLFDYNYVYKTRIIDSNGDERWFFVFDNDEQEFIKQLHNQQLYDEYMRKETESIGKTTQIQLDLDNII